MKRAVQLFIRLIIMSAIMVAITAVPKTYAWSAPESRMTGLISLQPGVSAELPFPATHLVVRWNGDDSAIVQVRGTEANGTVGQWFTAVADESGDDTPADESEEGRVSVASTDGDHGSETQESGLVVVKNAVSIEARIVSGSASDIRVAALDTENGPRHLEVVDKTSDRAEALYGLTPQPKIISRSQWGADESLRKGTPDFAPISKVIVHHTATSNNDPNPAATVRAIYAWHTQGNGWNDIGYNFLIDQSGNVYEGRYARTYNVGEQPSGDNAAKQGVIGAHATNNNTGTVGISMLGTFTASAPTAAQQNSLTRMIAWESDRHGLNPTAAGTVLAHRDVGQTTCPGDGAYNLLPQFRQQAAAIMTLAYPTGNTPGYWIAESSGAVSNYGAAASLGSMAGKNLNQPVIAMSVAPSNNGYWLLARDGGIFSFGNATFHGSTGAMKLNAPIVGMATTKSGNGYWLVAADGGIFSFGDAVFQGSTGNIKLNQPIVGMATTKSGNGYWLVAADGGVFSFGDATFQGSTGNIKLNSPVTTITTSAAGDGYLLMADDGGVFAFNTPFFGSIPMLSLAAFGGVAQAAATSTGNGYYVLARDGGIYTFGDAKFHGASTGRASAGIAVLPEQR